MSKALDERDIRGGFGLPNGAYCVFGNKGDDLVVEVYSSSSREKLVAVEKNPDLKGSFSIGALRLAMAKAYGAAKRMTK